MDFSFTQEQNLLRESTRDFMASKQIQEWIHQAEATKEYPFAFMKACAQMGYLGMNVSAEYGGVGVSFVDALVAFEEMAYASVAFSLNVLVQNSLFGYAVDLFGSQAQKQKYLVPAVKGELFGCFANTEPEVGSDAKNIRTIAVKNKKGDKWLLSGTKRFCTSAAVAQAAVVFARTAERKAGEPGITAFLIDIGPNVKGYKLDRVENKNAQLGTLLCEFTLDKYEAGPENILGQVGRGWDVCDGTFRRSRIWIAMQGIGAARRALEEVIKYTSVRKTFGKPIFQHVGPDIARHAVEIEAARLLTYKAAWLEENNDSEYQIVSSMAKYAAAEAAQSAVLMCYRYFGGISVVAETISNKLVLDSLIIPIYEGPSEIQLAVVAKQLFSSTQR